MLKTNHLFYIALSILCLSLFSCEKEASVESELLGVWELNKILIEGSEQTLSSCETNASLKFELNSLCKVYDACIDTTYNDSWSLKNGMLNVLSKLPETYTIDQLENQKLILSSLKFSSEGTIITTEYFYIKK